MNAFESLVCWLSWDFNRGHIMNIKMNQSAYLYISLLRSAKDHLKVHEMNELGVESIFF